MYFGKVANSAPASGSAELPIIQQVVGLVTACYVIREAFRWRTVTSIDRQTPKIGRFRRTGRRSESYPRWICLADQFRRSGKTFSFD